jgi:predicted PurR-regulated permease PerM
MKQYTTEFYFLLALITGAFVLAFFIFQPFIVPLIFAVVFATVFNPLYRRILKWTGEKRRGLAALLATISVLLVAVVPITFLVIQIFKELTQFYLFLASPGGIELILRIEDIVVSFRDFIPGAADFSFNAGEYTGRVLNWGFTHLSTFLGSMFSILMSLFIFLISLFYLFKDGETLQKEAIRVSPLQDEYDREIVKKLELAINSVVRGNLTVALVQGILTSIGFLIFGVPNPALWGGVAAIAALIPSFGTSLVIIPAVLFLFAIGNAVGGIGLLIWGAVAVGLIDNFLGPKLVERGIRIHPFLILLSILGGLGVFGPIGFLLGPLTLSLLYALLEIFATVRRRQGV